ncbi:unnamed protein product [Didymodactylos carnosus]|uniref:Uncharacterized protein n=1 Tax=Didymodactylos carnosus TaxID=1234261 RepID=A0A815L0V9_9BILA|nr:unnamed protein product [Didymodactylos carnosus]CAF4295854.1 unnamed protein product [Didymodactylos carnosus]
MTFKSWINEWWKPLIILLTPLVLLPLPLVGKTDQTRCGYIVLILIIYWMTEAIPLPVTSILPLILFPLSGVVEAKSIAPNYFQDIISLFFGSVAVAYAVECVNLHRRIALFVLSFLGSSIKCYHQTGKKYKSVVLGFLLATAYSASIGGLATLVGASSNIYVKGFTDG